MPRKYKTGSESHSYKHGFGRHPLIGAWRNMIYRCTKPLNNRYKWYGAKGIKVCKRWLKFENFLEDMGERPSPDHSIDRFPDHNGDYKKSNCRWATRKEQGRNRTNNVILKIDGISKTLPEWCEIYGISYGKAKLRYRRGWAVKEIFRP